MKVRSILFTLLLSFALKGYSSDNSSRTLYILADTPVSVLDLGLYKLDLALERDLKPELAQFLNLLPESVHNRTFITVGQDTSMVLILETTVDAAPDRDRSQIQSQNICELVQGVQVRFMRAHRLIDFFKTKNPFSEKLPDDFAENLDAVLRLKVRVPMGGAAPATECMRPLRAAVDG